MEPTALTPSAQPTELSDLAMSPQAVLKQAALIQQVMQSVMRDGEHYGVIPGTSGKKSLLKSGAEKLCFTFGLSNRLDIQVDNLPNGHREYRIICNLFDRSGNQRGQGVGSASTMESKHRYRGAAGKPCPKCGSMACQPSKKDFGGGYYCNAKAGGCGWSTKAGTAECKALDLIPSVRQENQDPADQYNCVTPETRILTSDLRWVRAGDIRTGDELIGVEEELSSQYARHFAIGKATVMGRRNDDLYEVAFDGGRTVRCNGEHKWLVKKIGLKGTEWVSTADIAARMAKPAGRPRKWSVMSVCSPWYEDTSKGAGYVAGLLDADGSLGIAQILVMFAQQQNVVLDAMREQLRARGFRFGMSACKTQAQLDQSKSGKQVYSLRVLGGLDEQMRLLGTFRPPRLLYRWMNLADIATRRLEGRGSGAGKPVVITSIAPIGVGEIVMIGSSCRTYIAEGMVCHNTVLKMAKKRALVDAVLTATAASDIFAQDLEDLEDKIHEDDPAPAAARTAPAGAPPPEQPAKAPEAPAHPAVAAARELYRTLEKQEKGLGKRIIDRLCRLAGGAEPKSVPEKNLEQFGKDVASLAKDPTAADATLAEWEREAAAPPSDAQEGAKP